MAMLEEAKKSAAKPVDKKSEKDEAGKKHKPKKHATSAPSEPKDDEAAEGENAGDAQEPGSETEGAEQQDGAGSADAPNPPQQPQAQGGQQDQDDGDSGGGNSDGGQPAQQGGAQGGAPVPSPAAPGAGDTTSGGEDTPDQDQGPEAPGEDTPAGPGSNTDLQQVPMSPGLKDEYDQANQLLMQLLYQSADDKLAGGVLQGLMPQGPAKIKNTAMVAIQIVVQIHKKLQLPPQLILPFAKDVVSHVMDLGQQVKQIQYSDQESTAILGAVYESAMRIFGVNKGQVKNAANHVGKAALQKHQAAYQQAHAHAKPAIDANNAAWHHDHLAGQQGAPTTAGPQTGAPIGAQTAPQEGGPPPANAGPPPAGGMLSQAAAQPQEGESNG